MTKLPPAFAKHLRSASRPQPSPASTRVGFAALLRQAEDHLEKGEVKQAEQLCMAVLSRAPKNVDALLLAATLAEAIGDTSLELVFLQRAVTADPRSAATQLRIAAAYDAVREHETAIGHYRKAFDLKPDMQSELGALARSYTAAGKAEMALPLFERLIKLRPDHQSVRFDYANALIGLGRMEEADALLRENVARGFRKAVSLKVLADTRKYSSEPEELQTIRQALEASGTSQSDRMYLHHAAGKIFNDLGRYEEAIDHMRLSKEASSFNFDASGFRKRVDTLIAAFTPPLLREKALVGNASEVPVFVVGMPRSGTTLTEQICSSHPAVFGAGELPRLGTIMTTAGYAQTPDGSIRRHPEALNSAEAKKMAADYLEFVQGLSPASARIVDKMPHNFQYVGMIAIIFPNARIIHCTRDPIDNCLSCFFNTFNENHGYNTNLTKLGLYYRDYHRLMRHWHELLPGRIYEANYETMIADQEGETRRLIDFLGLPWDDACLRFYENERTVITPSRWQVRQPIYASSVKRWKKYGDRIQPLIDSLGDLADA